MKIYAFTKPYGVRAREINTEIQVSRPIIGENIRNDDTRLYKTIALWDTGATNSVITHKTAEKLELKPISATRVHHAGGSSIQNVYLVNIYLPNNVFLPAVRVTECDNDAGDFGVIIGMDIISQGDFAFTNVDGNSILSFRQPSVENIDYVKYKRGIPETPYIAPKKTNPNELCPCGSGKKYKRCCKD